RRREDGEAVGGGSDGDGFVGARREDDRDGRERTGSGEAREREVAVALGARAGGVGIGEGMVLAVRKDVGEVVLRDGAAPEEDAAERRSDRGAGDVRRRSVPE